MRTEGLPPPDVLETIQRDIQSLLRSQSDDLWGADEVAFYMKLSKKSVQNRILTHDTFPEPIKLPSGEKRGAKRWVPKEVRAWALKHR